MLPYPAYAVGNATALQLGNACVAVACVPALWRSWRRQPLYLYLLLVCPLMLSALAVTASGSSQAPLAFKALMVWAMSLMAVMAAQLHAPRHALAMLTGIALATVLHAAVGLLQVYAFAHDQFPLPGLYVNPSFLSVQDNLDTIARWTKRPFGIFPEPSAMSCSLSPWVVIWVALLGNVVRLRRPAPARHQLLFATAAAGGLALIIVSRSGQAVVTLLAVLFVAGLWLARARGTRGALMGLMLASGVLLPAVLWFAAQSVGDRLGGAGTLGNSSWTERATSLVTGFSLYASGGVQTLLLGLGPGLSSFNLTKTAGLEAVWSVLLGYLYDTGVVGLTAVGLTAIHLVRTWRQSRYEITGAAVFMVWMVGVTLSTRYEQLLPPWLALGFLTVWPQVFVPVARDASAPRAMGRRPQRHNGLPGRVPGWRGAPAAAIASWPAATTTAAAGAGAGGIITGDERSRP
jgi:hypothetical protein